LQNNVVTLDWQTSQEQDNEYFTIEKSTNGVNFSFLTRVNGAGNSTSIISYRAFDNNPANGNNYYRLSQTNSNGSTTFFPVKNVYYKLGRNYTAVVSNISNGLRLNISAEKNEQFRVIILDAMGRAVKKETFTAGPGVFSKTYGLPAGVYVLRLTNSANETAVHKVVVQ
jgi:hypothetical protein